ncbi:YggT family protein [Treponema pectinovorum]|uniref:YggT family protein n=1 Tax=Treponema pectinovorum TaxID=164 RepID=UPI0011CCC37F|nr:YggT family protein [Treponema pectinovorum]
MRQFFTILATAINIYSFIILIRIFLTWIPNFSYSKFARILSSICDPFLNVFRKIKFLRFQGLDFSPALALCSLYALATIFTSLSHGNQLTVGYFLAVITGLIWSLISSIAKFLIALLVIRLIIYAVMRLIARNRPYNSYNPLWDQIDRLISPIVYKISGIFSKRILSFTTALIISIVFSILCVTLADFLIKIVCNLFIHLPF